MAKIMVEMDDTLEERVQRAINQVKEALTSRANKGDKFPELGDWDYSDFAHEAIDSSVPICNKELEDTCYLHKAKLISAYEDAGMGDNPMENNGMAAIYCYIEQRLYDWYLQNAESFFNELTSKAGV